MNDKFFTLLKVAVFSAYSSIFSDRNGTKKLEWFQTLTPGDLVMENSTVRLAHRDPTRFGYLIRDVREPMFSDEHWEEVKDQYGEDGRPTERVYYIKLLKDGTEMRWTNASFIRVPEDFSFADGTTFS